VPIVVFRSSRYYSYPSAADRSLFLLFLARITGEICSPPKQSPAERIASFPFPSAISEWNVLVGKLPLADVFLSPFSLLIPFFYITRSGASSFPLSFQ